MEASYEPRTAWNGGEPPSHHALLLAGSATVEADTPFGPYEVFSLEAPAVFGLAEVLLSAPRLGRLQLKGPSAIVRIGADETRRFVAADSLYGTCYRRLALASLVRAIRWTNEGLAKFFTDGKKFTISQIDQAIADAVAGFRDGFVVPPDVPETPGAVKAEAPSRAVPDSRPADFKNVRTFLSGDGLSPSTLLNLGLKERTYGSGEVIARTGEPAEEAYLIYSGKIRVSVEIPNAGTEALGINGEGDFLGEMALVDDSPRSADLTAHEGPVSVFVLTRPVFRRLLDEVPPGCAPLMAQLTFALARRLFDAIERSISFCVMAGGPPQQGAPQGFEGLPPGDDDEDDFGGEL